METYRHTQFGWAVVGPLAAVGLVLAWLNRDLQARGPGLVPLVVLGVVVLLFATLTVTVDRKELRARFGPGLVRKTIPLSEVASYGAVTNPWIWGWGIRLFPGGTLYNVSGLQAVELRLKDGRVYRIGTDEPEALERALLAAIGERRPLDGTAPPACRAGLPSSPLGKALVWALALAGLGVVAFVVAMLVLEPRPPRVKVGPESLAVSTFLYRTEVPLSEVTAVSLEDRLCVQRRTSGFSNAGVLRGHFDVQGLGNGMLFLDSGNPPFVLVRTPDRFVAIGLDDAARTRALHEEIEAARSRGR